MLQTEINRISKALNKFITDSNAVVFEEKLLQELYAFNNKYFPVPDYKYKVKRKEIDEKTYGAEKEAEFLPIYRELVNKYKIKLKQEKEDTFLDNGTLNISVKKLNLCIMKSRRLKIQKPNKLLV